MDSPDPYKLDGFVTDLIAPFSIHRAKYKIPHGTVARKQFKNRAIKRLNKHIAWVIAQETKKAEVRGRIDEVKKAKYNIYKRGDMYREAPSIYFTDRLAELQESEGNNG